MINSFYNEIFYDFLIDKTKIVADYPSPCQYIIFLDISEVLLLSTWIHHMIVFLKKKEKERKIFFNKKFEFNNYIKWICLSYDIKNIVLVQLIF